MLTKEQKLIIKNITANFEELNSSSSVASNKYTDLIDAEMNRRNISKIKQSISHNNALMLVQQHMYSIQEKVKNTFAKYNLSLEILSNGNLTISCERTKSDAHKSCYIIPCIHYTYNNEENFQIETFMGLDVKQSDGYSTYRTTDYAKQTKDLDTILSAVSKWYLDVNN